jgi:hypothetical protein
VDHDGDGVGSPPLVDMELEATCFGGSGVRECTSTLRSGTSIWDGLSLGKDEDIREEGLGEGDGLGISNASAGSSSFFGMEDIDPAGDEKCA